MSKEKLAGKEQVGLGRNGLSLTQGNAQNSSLVSSLTCTVSVKILVAAPLNLFLY